jgi:hypothetical protein
MSELGKTLISVENTVKLVVLLSGLSGVIWTIKMDNQALRTEVMLAVQGYKAADEKIELKIESLSKNDDRQDKDIDFLTTSFFALNPDQPRIMKRRYESK